MFCKKKYSISVTSTKMRFLSFPSNENNNLPETPRSTKIPNAFNHGKKTAKGRQKDGKKKQGKPTYSNRR